MSEQNKTLSDEQIAAMYLPNFYADSADPFPIAIVGYSVIRASGRSPSFNREVILPTGAVLAVEYAVYFDYDIQHLYDLEHAWIYVGADGAIVEAESSAHGGYMNSLRLAAPPENGQHLPLYLQPGKHAIFPRGELFMLYPNYLTCCDEDAGSAGTLVPDMLADRITKPDWADAAATRHIRANYRFTPTMRFVPSARTPDWALVPMDELMCRIPQRLNKILEEIKA